MFKEENGNVELKIISGEKLRVFLRGVAFSGRAFFLFVFGLFLEVGEFILRFSSLGFLYGFFFGLLKYLIWEKRERMNRFLEVVFFIIGARSSGVSFIFNFFFRKIVIWT